MKTATMPITTISSRLPVFQPRTAHHHQEDRYLGNLGHVVSLTAPHNEAFSSYLSSLPGCLLQTVEFIRMETEKKVNSSSSFPVTSPIVT
ncbi:hypothetical protein E2C01_089219 [Portunus trituberculatus]|uniref:Uncharacterized protein n=1 Tax=Portunus trituberculatus TaxID=210409 RepID=A0A5B7JLM2_PORTR|nr:hypothetical protein [Portunus trituberculatus]